MQHESSTAVLILAAGSIKNKYKSYSFIYNSPGLVPIASRSSLSFIIDFYEQRNATIYIVINEADEPLIKNELAYYTNINLITIAKSSGVNDTLAQVLRKISEENVIVNVVTTVPTVYPDVNTVFIENELSNNTSYSGIIPDGKKISFKLKKGEQREDFYAFTGIFHTQKQLLIKALDRLNNYEDLLAVVEQLSLLTTINYVKTQWIDTGHEINYADARKKLMSSRTFNSISVDEVGILTKRSKHTEKLGNEVRYVWMLPSELQILYPRILNSNLKQGEVMMEYYGYPNLSEYQLYRDIEPMQWKRIFDNLEHALTVMQEHPFSIGRAAFRQFYFDKTVKRVQDYLKSLASDDVFRAAKTLTINGLVCDNFEQLMSYIQEKVDALYDERDFCIMHGDFCFNNILFDTFSNTVKLIDPRGSFGDNCVGIYGDKKYDLAKLLHSATGNYDYIVNNLFDYQQNDDEIHYHFPLRNNQQILYKMSLGIIKKMNCAESDIMFIVGLLFLSMCPLHQDNQNRQRLMYAHGLYYINKYK